MNALAILLLIGTGAGVLFGSRKTALASFLVGCCYMTAGSGVSLGGINLPMFRLLLLLAITRMVMSGEGIVGGINKIDRVVIAWGAWMIFASLFHEWTPGSGPVYASGTVFNVLGFYFMMRWFCRDIESLEELFGILSLVLVPVALLMVVEQAVHKNFFAMFGGVPDVPLLRDGRFRAQGPFSHAILAGTVGAGCIPLIVATWKKHRGSAAIGLAACLLMVLSSASSGPIMSVIFGIGAMCLWWKRHWVGYMLKAAIPVYIALSLVMERPPYFLISKIDLTGSSTGWHRSYLIQETIRYLNEWWLFGTDYTIHWMPFQGHISDKHTDITNQFIAYGVGGGLMSIILFVAALWMVFRVVHARVQDPEVDDDQAFFFWCIGSSLFALCASGISVAFFGQSVFFLWLPIACLASFARVPESGTIEHADEMVAAE